MTNQLNFSGSQIQACWIQNAQNVTLDKETILVNLSPEKPIRLRNGNSEEWELQSWQSTVVENVTILQADLACLLEVDAQLDFEALKGEWDHLSSLMPAFPANVPLYKSKQDTITSVTFVAERMLNKATALAVQPSNYEIRVNLWFAPAGTDCLIHNHASDRFLEIHTQVAGIGRMQKFLRQDDIESKFEDVHMAPGTTHSPFATHIRPDGGFHYPWHQYYAQTDCVWLAVEFHPTVSHHPS